MKLFRLILCFFCSFIFCGATYAAEDTLLLERARDLTRKGELDSAYATYSRLRAIQDSTFYQNYDRSITAMYDARQIDNQKNANKRFLYKFLFIVLIVLSALTILIFILFHFLKRHTARLIKSSEDLKAAKEMAELSVKNKSTAISNMSHEIRTPLNSIVGFSSIVADSTVDKETLEQCDEIITLNSQLLLKLINDIVDISSLHLDNLSLNLKFCDVVAICNDTVSSFSSLHNTNAKILFESSFSSYSIQTDPTRLQQVLYNLMSNAVKFCKEGTIILSFEKWDKRNVKFSLTDTGCGIPIEKQKTIFNRYERVNEITQGTGIGLSLCVLILKRLGGTIWIDNDYTNGARFIFIHPIKQEVTR